MKKTIFFVSAAMLLVFGLSSCDKLGRIGKPVTFSASAHGEAATKTQYAGGLSGSDTHEAIYWSSGDQILIQSSNTDVAATLSGGASASYSLTVNDINASFAQPGNIGDVTALVWNETEAVTFYGVYPASTTTTDVGVYSMNIPTSQTYASPTASGNMGSAYMVAKSSVSGGADEVKLDFYPAFTAFEINMKSADGTITLNSFAIKSTTQDLAGEYVADCTGTWTNNKPAFSAGGTRQKAVSVTFPSGTTITPSNEVSFTLLALPDNLTSLYLEVTYQASGVQLTKRLPLKNTSGYLTFAGCKKHRITGLVFNGSSDLLLTVNGEALPWDHNEDNTSFASNIESSPFNISNATETGNHYYPTGTKDYQVRTLDIANGYSYFDVKFTPGAPLGGYWMLVPESNGGLGTAAFRVVLWDDEDDTDLLTDGDPDLKGQIMNQEIHFRVISTVSDAERTQDHAIIIKSYFSTSISFDENSTYSADSEIQDAHKDGSFSYWRFVIPAKNN